MIPNGWLATDHDRTSATQEDGGIYSSVDLCLWQKCLYRDKGIISAKYVGLMTSPYTETGRKEVNYGFGLYVTKLANKHGLFHDGQSIGFSNALFYFPGLALSLAVLSNIKGTEAQAFG